MGRIVVLDEWYNMNLHANWFPTASNRVLLKVDIYAYVGGGGVSPPPPENYTYWIFIVKLQKKDLEHPRPRKTKLSLEPNPTPTSIQIRSRITCYLLYHQYLTFFLDLFILGRNHYIYKNKVMKIKWYLKLCPFKEAGWSTNQINYQIFLKF